MPEIRNYSTGDIITRFASLTRSAVPRQVVNIALDGTSYIQTIGAPTVSYEVEAYVRPRGRALLEQAWADTAILAVTVRSGLYYGRITELKFGERMAQDWYQANMTLAKEIELE